MPRSVLAPSKHRTEVQLVTQNTTPQRTAHFQLERESRPVFSASSRTRAKQQQHLQASKSQRSCRLVLALIRGHTGGGGDAELLYGAQQAGQLTHGAFMNRHAVRRVTKGEAGLRKSEVTQLPRRVTGWTGIQRAFSLRTACLLDCFSVL